MIIDEHKVIFVHIPKNAGTSIKKLLLEEKEFKNRKSFWKHETIYDIKKDNINAYNNYKKFAIVRDPYSRMVSWYSYMGGYLANNDLLNTYQWNGKDYEIVETEKPNINGFKAFVKDPFDQYPHLKFKNLLEPQFKWVDETVTILKYENIEEELKEFFGEKIDLQIINKTIHDDFSVYYDKESLDIVYNRYREDFKRFNYDNRKI